MVSVTIVSARRLCPKPSGGRAVAKRARGVQLAVAAGADGVITALPCRCSICTTLACPSGSSGADQPAESARHGSGMGPCTRVFSTVQSEWAHERPAVQRKVPPNPLLPGTGQKLVLDFTHCVRPRKRKRWPPGAGPARNRDHAKVIWSQHHWRPAPVHGRVPSSAAWPPPWPPRCIDRPAGGDWRAG